MNFFKLAIYNKKITTESHELPDHDDNRKVNCCVAGRSWATAWFVSRWAITRQSVRSTPTRPTSCCTAPSTQNSSSGPSPSRSRLKASLHCICSGARLLLALRSAIHTIYARQNCFVASRRRCKWGIRRRFTGSVRLTAWVGCRLMHIWNGDRLEHVKLS